MSRYLVVWTMRKHKRFTDKWQAFDDKEDAQMFYESLLQRDRSSTAEGEAILHTASICVPMTSTDYETVRDDPWEREDAGY